MSSRRRSVAWPPAPEKGSLRGGRRRTRDRRRREIGAVGRPAHPGTRERGGAGLSRILRPGSAPPRPGAIGRSARPWRERRRIRRGRRNTGPGRPPPPATSGSNSRKRRSRPTPSPAPSSKRSERSRRLLRSMARIRSKLAASPGSTCRARLSSRIPCRAATSVERGSGGVPHVPGPGACRVDVEPAFEPPLPDHVAEDPLRQGGSADVPEADEENGDDGFRPMTAARSGEGSGRGGRRAWAGVAGGGEGGGETSTVGGTPVAG
jgi:hypothetical protein